jgi:hypothetical protein
VLERGEGIGEAIVPHINSHTATNYSSNYIKSKQTLRQRSWQSPIPISGSIMRLSLLGLHRAKQAGLESGHPRSPITHSISPLPREMIWDFQLERPVGSKFYKFLF